MKKRLLKLRKERAAKVAVCRGLVDAAEADDRELTGEERAKFDAAELEVGNIDASIEREENLIEMERATGIEVDDDATITGGDDRQRLDPTGGFESFGAFAQSVIQATRPGAHADPRLIGAAPTTYGNEGAGVDGGFLVPIDYGTEIAKHSLEEDAFLPLTDQDPVTGNSMEYPSDETTPWGATGINAYWEGEGDAAGQSKPFLGRRSLRLSKLMCLVPMTEELMADAAVLSSYVPSKSGEAIRWKTNDAIMNGTGAGQPAGIFGSAAKISQAAEVSQTAATVNAQNIVKMFARSTNPGRSVWVINPDVFPQLPLLSINNQPVYTAPGNGIKDTPAGLLLGRPVVMSDTCQTLGAVGDINFIDFKAYKTITKASGIEYATSMHLWFDQAIMAFRVIFRIDGKSWVTSAITPPNSSVTRSPFVALAVRS